MNTYNKNAIIVGCGNFGRTTVTEKVIDLIDNQLDEVAHILEAPKKEITMKIENTYLDEYEFYNPPETRQERRRKDRALKKKHNRKF